MLFLNAVQVGSNLVTRVDVDIRPSAKLLFVRHLEAELRKFGTHSRSGWGEGEYEVVYLAGKDQKGKGVPCFLGWGMVKEKPIRELWLAVGTEGRLSEPANQRVPTDVEKDQLKSRIKDAVAQASKLATRNATSQFHVAFRIDGSLPVLPHKPIEFGENCAVSLPRLDDADKRRFGQNPAVGLMFPAKGTDEHDTLRAARDELFSRVLLWSFVSRSHCHASLPLFSTAAPWSKARKRLLSIRLKDNEAKSFQVYMREPAAKAFRRIRRVWESLENTKGENRIRLLSSLAAYRTALEVQSRSYHTQTLAVVSYIAALEASSPQPRRCSGMQSCDICGQMGTGHNLESHVSAILNGLRSFMEKNLLTEAEKVLKYAYRTCRSAYVHSARTPFDEFRGASSFIADIYDAQRFWDGWPDFRLLSRLEEIAHAAIDHNLRVRH